jgi:hypothetical protein
MATPPSKTKKTGQTKPRARTTTAQSPKIEALDAYRASPRDKVLTTNQGLPIADDENSLRAGERGPTLLEDFILREKITHFDHERIPERVVHARGAAAHGYFQVYESMAAITRAAFLADPSVQTPVFVRFSTVGGSRGSADTPRDVRGFAVKFYTPEGNFDLVGFRACRQTRAAQRDSTGVVSARYALGFRLADARVEPHDDVADVRSRLAAFVRHHGRFRRPHVSVHQRAE